MTSDRIPRRANVPPDQALLAKRLKLIRSAACFVELARLTKTWVPALMEAEIEGKGISTKHVERTKRSTSKYSRYRKGVVLRKETFDALEKKYEPANAKKKNKKLKILRYWFNHPIGVLLLDQKLSYEQIIRTLEDLPKGHARQLIWDECRTRRQEIPDSADVVAALAALQSVEGLTAILCKLRLRLLLAGTEDFDLYEIALLDCFPEVVAHSVHLSIARYSLMQALADFLDWQCGWRPINQPASTPEWSEAFWSSLWHRFDKASTRNAAKRDLELDVDHVLQQKEMEDSLETGGMSVGRQAAA